MKTLTKYIVENSAIDKIVSTSSNKERREALKKYLHGKYDDYLEKLDEMCKDVKSRALLDDAFGGELGDIPLKFSEESIAIKRLMPTQNEIGFESTLKHLMKTPENVSKCYSSSSVEILSPLVTFNKNYIIDGHHRWSEILCCNPNAKAICLNYDGDLSVMQMLKATQGAIAAAIDYVPHTVAKSKNIYDCSEDEIREYIENNISDVTVKSFIENTKDTKDKESVIDLIMSNVNELIENHPVLNGAPKRELMPQTDKGNGLEPDGALSKMKNGNVLKI